MGVGRHRINPLISEAGFEEVRRLLGPSVYGKEGRYLTYDIGLERDSFFQVDPELLSIGFTKNGIYSAADIYQGNSIRYACPSAISRRSVQA